MSRKDSNEVLRVAVGSPDGITSNSWRIWVERFENLYIACRDSMREVKVSLHCSGRWRFGFTEESGAAERFLSEGANRAWEVWDRPALEDGVVAPAFRIWLLTSELAVAPEQRSAKPRLWEGVTHFKEGPPGKAAVFTVFPSSRRSNLRHQSEVSAHIAEWQLKDDTWMNVVFHHDPDEAMQRVVLDGRPKMISEARRQIGVDLPETAYGYLWGHHSDGARYVVPCRLNP